MTKQKSLYLKRYKPFFVTAMDSSKYEREGPQSLPL